MNYPQNRPATGKACLLSPSEWRTLVAIHRLGRAATLAEVCQVLPPYSSDALPDTTVQALLERLLQRGLIRYRADRLLWGPLTSRFDHLLAVQTENFLKLYVLDDIQALYLVRETVEGRLSSLMG